MDVMEARQLESFAREHLLKGLGEWWIVDEMARRWQVDGPDARAIVARVSPAVFRRFLRRRRVFFMAGVVIMAAGCVPAAIRFDLDGRLLSAAGLICGAFIAAYGWIGMKRMRRGDAPTSLPGYMTPARPTLFTLDPFDHLEAK